MPITYNPFSNRQIDPSVATRLGTTEQTVQLFEAIEKIKKGVLPEYLVHGFGSPGRDVLQMQESRFKLPGDGWYRLVSCHFALDNINEPTHAARLAFFVYGKNEQGNDIPMASFVSYYEVPAGEQRIFAIHPGAVLHTNDPLSMFVMEPLPEIVSPPGGEIGFNVRSSMFQNQYAVVHNLWMVWRYCGVNRPA